MSSDARRDFCTVVLEYPPCVDVAGVVRGGTSGRKTERWDECEVFVDEDSRVFRITCVGGKHKGRSAHFSLNEFMYFNGHVERGKVGIKFLASRHNEKQVTVLLSSFDVSLIQDINAGILSLQKQPRRQRADIAKTPIQGSPIAGSKFRSPDLKKACSNPLRQPIFGFGCRKSPVPVKIPGIGKSPQVVFPSDHRGDDLENSDCNLSRVSGDSFLGKTSTRFHTDPPIHNPILQSSLFDPSLSSEQREVMKAVAQGESVFFTGSGGCGKSYLLKKIISVLPPATTAVTASTGIAACHIGGVTLHHFLGIGRVDPGVAGAAQTAIAKIRKNFEKSSLIKKTKTVIIDEISLVDKGLFELMHEILSGIRGVSDPLFGGIQIVCCGDFLQLPPVGDALSVKFCFQSKLWRKKIKKVFYLSKIFRQQDDPEFTQLLNEIRFGVCSESSARVLLGRKTPTCTTPNSSSVKLVPLNREVNEINDQQLARLLAQTAGEKLTSFVAIDTVYDPAFNIEAVCLAKQKISLAVGARVILLATVSFSEKLVNGSTGVVVRLTQSPPVVYVRFDSQQTPVGISQQDFIFRQAGKEVARRRQIPLALAWAISIHKSQGMTLEQCQVSLDRIFENGQTYVALSRCKSLEGLSIISSRPGGLSVANIVAAVKANPVCVDYYKKLIGEG